MKLKIRHKLFFTILLTSAAVAAGLFVYLQWSFDRGFLNYIRTQEVADLNRLSGQLAAYYEERGGWGFIADNYPLWQHIHRDILPPHPGNPRHPAGPPPGGFKHDRPPLPPVTVKNIGPRVILYGEDKTRIIGGPPEENGFPAYMHPISSNGEVIGYLGLAPITEISEMGDLMFAQDQTKKFAFVTLAMVLLSILLTFPVTSHLLRPIKEITRGTRKLIGGKFTTRIPITSSDELGDLSRDFNMLASTLEKNELARRQWVADIAHELRTPLSILRGEVEAIFDGVRVLNIDNLEPLHSEVLHLERLVNDLYELSMSDIGALTYRKRLVNPAGILEEAIDLFEKRFEEKGLILSTKIESDFQHSFLADPDRLQQLFTNLLENSLRYTDVPGKLEISIEYDGGHINISFEDSGPGVEAQKLEKIFERLYRVEPSRNRTAKGAGLGLSICHNIVDAHQGKITAKNSPLGGLTLRIRLPAGR